MRYSLPFSPMATALRPVLPMLASRALITLPAGIAPSSSIRASIIWSSSTSAARVSPIPCSASHSGNVVARAFEQHARFGQRQPDDVRIAAGDVPHVDLAIALKRVAAGLAAPFAVACVISDLFVRQPLHGDRRFHQPFAHARSGYGEGDAGQNAMPTARQQLHARAK